MILVEITLAIANLLNNQELTSTKVATIQVAGNLTGMPWEVDTATTPAWVSLTPSTGVVGASAPEADARGEPSGEISPRDVARESKVPPLARAA